MAWFDRNGLGADRAPALAIRPRIALGGALPRGPGEGDEDGGSPGERARRRIDRIVAQARAADLARYPDARWTDLQDRMSAGFSPTAALPPRRVADDPAPLEEWARAAERYGRTGSPGPARASEPPGAIVARSRARDLGFEEWVVGLVAAGGSAVDGPEVISRVVTIIAIEQGAGGEVLRAWLLRSSGSAAHDQGAVGLARRLRGARGLDLPHVGRSDWAFTSELVRPRAGPFDANFRPVPARDREPRVRTRVELVAIWMPDDR